MTGTAIFIRTYWKDLEWLRYCLQAIRLHCRGFSETVVVVPKSTLPWLRHARLPEMEIRVVACPDYKDDYLGQQLTKLFADAYTDADYIAHVDADCIFSRKITPEDLHPQGRPFLIAKPVSELGRHYPWRTPVEDFLGFAALHDYMQQPPFVFPRGLYKAVRDHGLERHGTPLDAYVLSRPLRGFSEFNVLGAYAWRFHREEFSFHVAGTAAAPRPCCDWHWSWGGLTPEIRCAIRARADAR
ncbi:hypothetical protein IYY11_14055 [Methylocystis sp. H62]|uniref:DUF6492 family protein n=1 Tax=Methylocystis sp. H62 TaxID=2785789 RepID=UPI0018C28D2E|nr:DUF6492 family protein [Methylocystis sp. H62]MBG0794476.1 hypothetical protein [Methylocystis sp. H62]